MNKFSRYFLQISFLALLIFFAQSSTKAQTALEQQCFDGVQGKVAYNQAGNKSWSPENIQRLCRGTTNPSNTIACFQAQIKQHNDWSRGINACQSKVLTTTPTNNPQANRSVSEKSKNEPVLNPSPITNVQTVTFKNNGIYSATLFVSELDDSTNGKTTTTGQLEVNQTKTINVSNQIKDSSHLVINVEMKLADPSSFIIYRGAVYGENRKDNICFEAKGDLFNPYVEPCGGTKATEQKKVELKHEGGFIARASLKYFVNGVAKSVPSGNITQGVRRYFYLPSDADLNKDMTLSVDYNDGQWLNMNDYPVRIGSRESTCYKISGGSNNGKINPCSTNPNARTIKFKNNGGYDAELTIVYDGTKQIKSGRIALLQTSVQEVPNPNYNVSGKTIEVYIKRYGYTEDKFYTTRVAADFQGELCFKSEGTTVNPTGSTCDDTVGVVGGSDTRQIKFQNDAGYDAEAVVMYSEYQTFNGTKVPIQKSLTTGFINLGKSRMITIPKDVVPGTKIQIFLKGNATVKGNNAIFFTTLPADFAGSPVPCFKVWGSLFDPAGGKCNQ